MKSRYYFFLGLDDDLVKDSFQDDEQTYAENGNHLEEQSFLVAFKGLTVTGVELRTAGLFLNMHLLLLHDERIYNHNKSFIFIYLLDHYAPI